MMIQPAVWIVRVARSEGGMADLTALDMMEGFEKDGRREAAEECVKRGGDLERWRESWERRANMGWVCSRSSMEV